MKRCLHMRLFTVRKLYNLCVAVLCFLIFYMFILPLTESNTYSLLTRMRTKELNAWDFSSISANETLRWKYANYSLKNSKIPLLILFTTWRLNSTKQNEYTNTINNWLSLRPYIKPVLFTDEEHLGDAIRDTGWDVLPVPRAAQNIPVLKDMYLTVRKKYNSYFYGFANGDILFTDSILYTLEAILKSSLPVSKPTMVIGRRTNVVNVSADDVSSWRTLERVAEVRGDLFCSCAEDYFITTRNYPWENIPDLVIGRKGYDNWLVLNNRKLGYITIDATFTVLAVHQTTEKGNLENQYSENTDYNLDLLNKMYKGIDFRDGLTHCTEMLTAGVKMSIEVVRRTTYTKCYLKFGLFSAFYNFLF